MAVVLNHPPRQHEAFVRIVFSSTSRGGYWQKQIFGQLSVPCGLLLLLNILVIRFFNHGKHLKMRQYLFSRGVDCNKKNCMEFGTV